MGKKKSVELQIHRDAFELYFLLGDETPEDIKIKMISEQYGKHRSTIYEWRKRYDWRKKKEIREKLIHEELMRQTNQTIVENKAKYLTTIHAVLDHYEDQVRQGIRGPLEILKTTDLDRIIKLALYVQGNDGTGTDPPKEPIEKSMEEKKEEFNEYFNEVEASGKAHTEGQTGDSSGDTIEPANPTQSLLEADPVSSDRD